MSDRPALAERCHSRADLPSAQRPIRETGSDHDPCPILHASPAIQVHTAAALFAIVLGPAAIWRRSRDRWHRIAGYAWVTAMAVTALSAALIFQIRVIGPFSPVHALIPVTLWSLWRGIAHVRAGRIDAHRAALQSLYVYALGVAGLFTFLPGRTMNNVFFGGGSWVGFFGVLALLPGIAAVVAPPRIRLRFLPFTSAAREAMRRRADHVRSWRNW